MCPLWFLFVFQCVRKGAGRDNNLELTCPWLRLGYQTGLFDASVPAVNHYFFQLKGVKSRYKKFKENRMTLGSDV